MQLDEYRTLGRSGLRVSPLTLGAMIFGDPSWGADDETSHRIIDRYREAGGNVIDTANGYGDGRSEEVIGDYFAKRPGQRDRMVVATKFAGNLFPGDPNGGGAGRKSVRRQVDASLRRLRTDYIDLYWQHNWDRHTPLEETMSTLDELVRDGKVNHVGFSDTPAWAVARSATIAEFRGWTTPAAIQVEYSLLQRTVEGEQFGVVRELGLGVTPWSPLARGVLSGQYTRDSRQTEGPGRGDLSSAVLNERTFRLVDVLGRIAADLGSTVPAVAMAWVREQPEVTSTIIGARSIEQVVADIGSLDVDIPDDLLEELDKLTHPALDFPADLLIDIAIPYQQGGTTINEVPSEVWRGKSG